MDRPVDRLAPRQRFLIVCEGERTEPEYFSKFPIPRNCVVDVRGAGANTMSLIRKTVQLRDDARDMDGMVYDQVWCVFDRDSFPPGNFNAAFEVARQNNIEIAYSNEAFELWFILHFQYLDTGLSRDDYIKLLSKNLGHPYNKKSDTTYDELLSRQATAIKNAKNLYSQYAPHNPEKDKPSTTVHILVERLNSLSWGFGKD